MSLIEDNLSRLGLSLPDPAAPVASYVPALMSCGQLYISGQIPLRAGQPVTGHVGDGGLSLEEGQEAAQLCGLMILAQARAALEGDLSRLARCVKLTGFVACGPQFTDHPKVINGASDLMLSAMGDAGRHTRAAVGVASLPLGVAVEVDALFALTQ